MGLGVAPREEGRGQEALEQDIQLAMALSLSSHATSTAAPLPTEPAAQAPESVVMGLVYDVPYPAGGGSREAEEPAAAAGSHSVGASMPAGEVYGCPDRAAAAEDMPPDVHPHALKGRPEPSAAASSELECVVCLIAGGWCDGVMELIDAGAVLWLSLAPGRCQGSDAAGGRRRCTAVARACGTLGRLSSINFLAV